MASLSNSEKQRRYAERNPEKYKELRRLTRIKNKEKIAKYNKLYHSKNKEVLNRLSRARNAARRDELLIYNVEYYQRNADRLKEAARKWRKNNPEISRNHNKKRMEIIKSRTPPWLTREMRRKIREIYFTCEKGFEVDHVVPLQGKNVCGLHVPWNLQIIPATENRKKSNKY